MRIDRDQVAADTGSCAISGKIEDRDVRAGGLFGEGAKPRTQVADAGVLAQIDVKTETDERCGNILGVVDGRAELRRICVARISHDQGDAAAGGICFGAEKKPDGDEQGQPAHDPVASFSRCRNGVAA